MLLPRIWLILARRLPDGECLLRNFDCAVLGAGVFGAWIAYRLVQAGRTVTLVDPLGAGNSRSSSGGESRIIRSSYGPDEIYTRWAMRSLSAWKQVFDDVKQPRLFQRTGVLWTAPQDDPRVASNLKALTNSGVPFEPLDHALVKQRWPQIQFTAPVAGIFEPEGGVVLARRAVQAVVAQAIRRGVEFSMFYPIRFTRTNSFTRADPGCRRFSRSY